MALLSVLNLGAMYRFFLALLSAEKHIPLQVPPHLTPFGGRHAPEKPQKQLRIATAASYLRRDNSPLNLDPVQRLDSLVTVLGRPHLNQQYRAKTTRHSGKFKTRTAQKSDEGGLLDPRVLWW